MKITEVEGFPKSLLKKKTIPLYKAFIIKDSDDEMKINTNIDLLSITPEAAVSNLVNQIPLSETFETVWEGTIISFAIIKLDKDDLLTKDLVDNGEVFFQNDTISITLSDKIYKVDVEDMILKNIVIDVDQGTEIRICSNIELEKA